MKKYLLPLVACALFAGSSSLEAQIGDRERPQEWGKLVEGGRFKDRFLPMVKGKSSSDVWGAACVKPRYIDNGLEDATNSYWGGNILQDKNGLYHMYVCGWKEDSPKGHMYWPRSEVYHATAEKLQGPYALKSKIGEGHNPEAFVLKDGRVVVYYIKGYYIADSFDGPWENHEFSFDARNRKIVDGLSNISFAKREDGSVLAVCRGGGMWISKDGLSTYNQITDERVYPPVEGHFEDPVLWRDNVQYHMIVNDWYGRIAWYLRSKDGANWVVDDGEAYEPGIAIHADGSKEGWFKFERIKMFQDEYGRAIQANFAVIDTLKHHDLPKDTHSSKNITIPLNPGMLLSVENKEGFSNTPSQVSLRIQAEEGFNPQKQIDLKSLQLGLPKDVDYGKGFSYVSSKKDGKDLVVTFDTKGLKIPTDEFVLKVIGKDKKKRMVYGYTRIPGVEYDVPILSAVRPKQHIRSRSSFWTVRIDNFGQVAAEDATVRLIGFNGEKETLLGTFQTGAIEPYGSKEIEIPITFNTKPYNDKGYQIRVQYKGEKPNVLSFSNR